ncbi:MAG: ribose 5-phosphate isomerase B [Chitinophagales bacterium]|nr:ribose 5-phosphate isomerase B [Chitinophagales bacterium]
MKLAIGCDHAGFDYKEALLTILFKNHTVQDFGTHSNASCDYPDFVHPLAESIAANKNDRGILICGTANGVAITANKHKGIRAGIAWDTELAVLTRQHNNANIICIPARFVSLEKAAEIVHAFLETEFEGGRHQNRIDKIDLC